MADKWKCNKCWNVFIITNFDSFSSHWVYICERKNCGYSNFYTDNEMKHFKNKLTKKYKMKFKRFYYANSMRKSRSKQRINLLKRMRDIKIKLDTKYSIWLLKKQLWTRKN